MENNTFKKRPGTTDKGKDYEDLMVASLILKVINDDSVNDFKLSSNDDKFGAFDDVVIEVHKDDQKNKYALQLKHGNREKSLATSSLMENSGNFSIKKYFHDFQKLKDCNEVKLILFTNLKFDISHDGEIIDFKVEAFGDLKIKILKIPHESLFNTSSEGRCYKFEMVETEFAASSTEAGEYRKFFDRFYLYTNQANVDNIRDAISSSFQEMFSCNQSLFNDYFDFVTKWSIREGTKFKLDKELMKRAIAICLLSPFIEPFSCSNLTANDEQSQLIKKAIFEFNVTILEKKNCDSLKKIYGNVRSEIQDINEINKIGSKYQVSKNVTDLTELNVDQTTFLLWLSGKCPLIVTENNTTLKAINLCQNEKFVLLKTDSSNVNLESAKIFRNISDINSDSEVYRKILRTFRCSLQGKEKISLQTFVEQFDSLRTIVTANELVKMLDSSFIIGGKKEDLPIEHIERLISNNIIEYKFLNNVQQDTLVVISCRDKFDKIKTHITNFNIIEIGVTDLTNSARQSDFNSSSSNKNFKNDIYISHNICSGLEFKKICRKNPNKKNYHHLQVTDDDSLQWVNSKGSIVELDGYKNDGQFIQETKLFGFDTENNIEIVCADSGMGKSTLVKNIKNHQSSTLWTVLIYVKDHCLYFDRKNHNGNDFITYILDQTQQNQNDFELKLWNILREHGRIAFIWDGLDEVSNDSLQAIMDIAEQLSKQGFRQLLTSRTHLKKILENKFNVVSRTISPFDEEQQNNYIKNRLRLKLSSTEQEDIIIKIRKNIEMARYNDILGIPLQLFMVTELFRQDHEKYQTLFDDVFSITDLYDHFVDEKFNVYYKDKANLGEGNDEVKRIIKEHKESQLENYEKAALKVFLTNNDIVEQLNVNCEQFLVEIQEKNDRLGIITEVTKEGIPNFLHNSYGEFFVATYFYKNRNKVSKLKEFIFDERYRNIRFLLDLMLAKDCPMHLAVLCKNIQALSNCNNQSSSKDQGGRNVLHLACSWGERYPLLNTKKRGIFRKKYLIDDAKAVWIKEENSEYHEILKQLCTKCDPYEIDDLFNLNCLEYADECLCLLPIITLSSTHKVDFDNLKKFKDVCTVVYYSAQCDYSDVFDIIEKIPFIKTKEKNQSLLHVVARHNAKQCLRKMLSQKTFRNKINGGDIYGETPLHIACSGGHAEIVRILINSKADVNVADNDGFTPLFVACQNGHTDTVQLLINFEANVNIAQKNGHTPIRTASFNRHFEIVSILINSKADVNVADNDGNTPLYVACQNGHTDIAQLLIDFEANANIAQKDGWTPILRASSDGHFEIVRILTNSKADVNLADNDGFTPLYMACQNGHTNIVQLLVDFGANVNAVTKTGHTPTDIASFEGYHEIVRILSNSNTK